MYQFGRSILHFRIGPIADIVSWVSAAHPIDALPRLPSPAEIHLKVFTERLDEFPQEVPVCDCCPRVLRQIHSNVPGTTSGEVLGGGCGMTFAKFGPGRYWRGGGGHAATAAASSGGGVWGRRLSRRRHVGLIVWRAVRCEGEVGEREWSFGVAARVITQVLLLFWRMRHFGWMTP